MYADEFLGQSDEAVVRRAMTGCPDAFEELVARFGPVVRGMAATVVGYPAADDVAQDVLLAARTGLRGLRHPEHFTAWLRTVTRRRAVEVARRDRRDSAEIRADELRYHRSLTVVQTPDDILARSEDHAALHAAMGRLPDALATTLRMQYWHGAPQRRIADTLGVSLATVKWRVHEAKQRLRRSLRNTEGNDDG
ncbi:sigma-70 family RNA polymerase sigma factor [Candidatus Poribacteria bacterium]|nr:sigma-70 family RNA polymerase sigma factor [Candidatus Poribacteria bacterium]MBT5533961.1 sigma-70 family RNA polymerase sigma factor [Candidatus Poribacteria bacterium]MBT5709745.1 sigma-70 family RNA polymerase sigma factor [Candidatus Poribacteria bacterium]MBT7807015.1 sigma-70 family RNA polymerase sigma factor [Candidatus Poribacteria bacterium]